ncbi:MAG TPA: PqiC family protein [Candidatus Limnocylindrales bacterium]|nr:PqiC family protein [Candidatus Limnocylindrales bacterium]
MKQTAALVMLLNLSVAGCGFSLAPTPDPTAFYVLSPIDHADTPPSQSTLRVGIGPISLPEYTAETKIARRSGEASIDYIPLAQWAEPVEEGFSRALMQNLISRIGSPYVVRYPWYATQDAMLAVPVDVVRFEPTTDGRAVLVARWRIEDALTRRLLVSHESRIEEPVGGHDTAATVAALNRAIDRLAADIARAIADVPRKKR